MSIELNPQQLEACVYTDGPLLILAGAGTGKTRVLTQRIGYLITNGLSAPYEIMAVTFTNKAASEMLARTEIITNTNGIWIGTFHSLATKIIRSHTEALGISRDFVIIDVDDQWRLLKKIIKDMHLDDQEYTPKYVGGIIGRWKDLGLFPENLSNADIYDHKTAKVKQIYLDYQSRLKQLQALDFGDLLLFCIKLFKENPNILEYYQDKFRYILVDEYQDTNASQYLWLRLLSQKYKNICAVGDEDQSIYGWRGAEIRNIMKFTHDFVGAKIIRLEQNYRSTGHILNTANHLIANNYTRIGKNLWTEKESHEKVKLVTHINGIKEAEFIASTIKKLPFARNEIAVLVRASYQTRIIEEVFVQQQIAYKIIGGLKFYDRLEIKNALSYLRLSYNFDDSLAFERIINVPKRGIGVSTISQIQEYTTLHQCSYFRATKLMLENNIFKGKAGNTLNEFLNKVEGWNKLWDIKPCHQVAEIILEESGYIDSLKSENSLESESRLENLRELISNIKEFDNIGIFLEHVSLVNESDETSGNNSIKIMTMHAAKGLEFDAVFLPGWEEGNFPSKRSITERDGIEEERRLAYVAITRAKNILYIMNANSRFIYGEWQYNEPSIFIKEIIKCESVEQPLLHERLNSFKPSIPAAPKKEVDLEEIEAGCEVLHIKFGKGKVLYLDGNNAEVNFYNLGTKRIIKSFLVKA